LADVMAVSNREKKSEIHLDSKEQEREREREMMILTLYSSPSSSIS